MLHLAHGFAHGYLKSKYVLVDPDGAVKLTGLLLRGPRVFLTERDVCDEPFNEHVAPELIDDMSVNPPTLFRCVLAPK